MGSRFSRRCVLGTALCALLLNSCSAPKPKEPARLTVAAAANLADAFNEAAAAFRMETGTEVVLSFGSTAQLAQQIENGAPFDVFAAADTEHIDQLIEKGRIVAETRAVYARGQLALWIPQGEKTGAKSLSDLTRPDIRFIAVAQPELAPYGKAAVEAMKAAGLWEKLEGKLVYANNINMARQYATTGNADAAFTAYSLVLKDAGVIAKIDPKLYTPIDQALGLIASSGQPDLARRFIGYLTSAQGKALLRKGGYLIP